MKKLLLLALLISASLTAVTYDRKFDEDYGSRYKIKATDHRELNSCVHTYHF